MEKILLADESNGKQPKGLHGRAGDEARSVKGEGEKKKRVKRPVLGATRRTREYKLTVKRKKGNPPVKGGKRKNGQGSRIVQKSKKKNTKPRKKSPRGISRKDDKNKKGRKNKGSPRDEKKRMGEEPWGQDGNPGKSTFVRRKFRLQERSDPNADKRNKGHPKGSRIEGR